MKQIYEQELFNRGKIVYSAENNQFSPEAHLVLAKYFNFYIKSGAEYLSLNTIKYIEKNFISRTIPTSFYVGFPESVKTLSNDQILIDQLIHYIEYECGWTNPEIPSHSVLEEKIKTTPLFNKHLDVKYFDIITEVEANEIIKEIADNYAKSTRVLSNSAYEFLKETRVDGFPSTPIASKDTRVKLSVDLKKNYWLTIFDFVDFVDKIREIVLNDKYEKSTNHETRKAISDSQKNKTIKKLCLPNQYKKLITGILKQILSTHILSEKELKILVEKRKIIKGILHHIHFKPTESEKYFVEYIYNDKFKSFNSDADKCLKEQNVLAASKVLLDKGESALLRSIVRLLSNAQTNNEIEDIINTIPSKNPIILLQLLHLSNTEDRKFTWLKNNCAKTHIETDVEKAKRKTLLSKSLLKQFQNALRCRLVQYFNNLNMTENVYVDESMKNIAIPLQEGSSNSGYGVLPKGSRIKIADNTTIVRGFIYWEKVDDVDLAISCIDQEGKVLAIYNWCTFHEMGDGKRKILTYSGDQRNGFKGGTEYFDIDLSLIGSLHPEIHYITFNANVYSAKKFNEIVCKAGYMLRDGSGEVFDPRTVESAFTMTSDSTEASLFSVDVKNREFVWLNASGAGTSRVSTGENFDLKYFHTLEKFNLYDLYTSLYPNVVDNVDEADIIVSDEQITLKETQKQIKSCDIDIVLADLNRK